MPAELLAARVAMRADAAAQALRLVDQLLTRHRLEVFVHGLLRSTCPS
jgi:hypothetical protein